MGLSPQKQSFPDLGLLSVVVLVWGALRYCGPTPGLAVAQCHSRSLTSAHLDDNLHTRSCSYSFVGPSYSCLV